MKAILEIMLAFVLLLAVAERSSHQAKEAVDTDFTPIDAYIQSQMKAWHVPGAALVIVQNGKTVHLQTFGSAGKNRPVTPATPFEIGSCSKSITALAVMQLVEAGKLDLDAPVQQVLPWFHVADEGDSARITIRHLLNHTSGISLESSNAATMINPKGLTLEGRVRSMQGLVLTAEPGARYQYSNFNYIALAQMIETVSGQSYGDYLYQHIFSPLKMESSFTDPVLARKSGLSDGHTWWFGIPIRSLEGPRLDMLGAGYTMVSAEDMSHYLIAQLNGGAYEGKRILSAQRVESMREPTPLPDGRSNYGMGWVSYQEGGQQVINHDGQSASFTCSMILLPEQQIGIAVMANVSSLLGPHPAWSMANRVKNMLVTGEAAKIDTTYGQFYRSWNGGFLLATVLVVGSFISMLARRSKITKAQSKWRTVLPFLVDGLLALAAFFGLPIWLGWQKWRGMFIWQPDAACWCLAAGSVLLLKLGLRAKWMVGGKTKQTVTAVKPVSPKKDKLGEGPAPLQ